MHLKALYSEKGSVAFTSLPKGSKAQKMLGPQLE